MTCYPEERANITYLDFAPCLVLPQVCRIWLMLHRCCKLEQTNVYVYVKLVLLEIKSCTLIRETTGRQGFSPYFYFLIIK